MDGIKVNKDARYAYTHSSVLARIPHTNYDINYYKTSDLNTLAHYTTATIKRFDFVEFDRFKSNVS